MMSHMQVLEISLSRLLWVLTSSPENEAVILKSLKWDNIIHSIFRVTLVPDAAIMPPNNPYIEHEDQIGLTVELLASNLGCLSCALEYDVPHIQHSLVTNQKFLEQMLGAIQSKNVTLRRYAMSVILDVAYNLDTHQYLCKPHVIQAIIRTWKSAEENNATAAESVYLKYLAALFIALLCTTRQTFSSQYIQVAELMKKFLDQHDYLELSTQEDELGFKITKFLPFVRVAFFPYNTRRSMQACGSDPHYRNLQMMCIEMCVLLLQVSLIDEKETCRKLIAEQGLMDYVACLPGVLPAKSRAQQRAKDLVSVLRKEMHLQPPSLNTMARARLAVTHCGLEKVMNKPVQELLSDVYCPTL